MMDNSLLVVRDINHIYIVVERRKEYEKEIRILRKLENVDD